MLPFKFSPGLCVTTIHQRQGSKKSKGVSSTARSAASNKLLGQHSASLRIRLRILPPPQIMAPANQDPTSQAPSGATDAVLKPSEPVAQGSREVQGIDFNAYAQRSITVEELVEGYASMGFQATAVGEAVRIINEMVS